MNRRHFVVSTAALSALMGTSPATAQLATPEASPVACVSSSPAENTAIARRWYEEVLAGHDLTKLDALTVPEAELTSPVFQSVEDARVVLQTLLTAFPDLTANVLQTVAEGDFVTVRWLTEGTHTGDFHGYPPTGLPMSVNGINIFRFECGRIAEVWSEVNLIAVYRQLGLPLEPPASAATPSA